ncbi:sphingomyelin phosphodiesterase 2a isoform X2 [Triplophysa rosa]|uniref:sphingomyelin phosphodiesterase n=1 Tax=Triplophysa rosa TaxID=992332 RepID=A0A9W7TAW0_TRIRA|nr:sphingomyelin phosphodiesterase 2a isoform X1 [Triplophysa rosa]XP_057175147.1 sphingomyelin phosphodiesterase 2a isoform X2 [Triplophysa rosa]KAI7793835.1 Smpd2 protein [Triplophysa rosa]
MATERPVPDKLRVFSLNCWGIRFFSQHCAQRYEMIGDLLDREQHDIALLQEVWSERDFLFLKRKLSSSHPYAHYFKSGVIGSGLAVFSRHRIQDALLYQYSLNGHPYMLRHGDWFGGKAVGLVIVDVFGLKAQVYVTHLHAEYSRAQDEYLPHRIVQSWELLQFVRHTSCGADVVILGGDLNMHPQDLGNRLIRAHTGLRDCYTETDTFDGCEDGHTLIAVNHFTKKQDLIPFEKGIRIDYILMKGSKKVSMKCESLSTTKGSVAGKPFPYSDHEALTAELTLLQSEESRQHGQRNISDSHTAVSEQMDVVAEAQAVVKEGLCHTETLQARALHLMGGALLLLLLPLLMILLPCLCSCSHFSFTTTGLLLAAGAVLLLSGLLLYLLFTTHIKVLKETEDQMKLTSDDLQSKLAGSRASGFSSSDGSPESSSPFKREE